MRAYVSALSVPKLGSRPEECEDAFSITPQVAPDEIIDTKPILVAVADGASESLLARHWAKTLTTTIVRAAKKNPNVVSNGDTFAKAILHAINEWDAWLAGYLAHREEQHNPIRWYERPGLERGAHSTLIAAHFAESSTESGKWHASALGDACLFQIRDDILVQAFPITHSTDFDSSPALLGSSNRDVKLISLRVQLTSGDYRAGDQFFLGTDALAAWFLENLEGGGRPWEPLRDVSCNADPEEFNLWVEQQRLNGRMRNDDVTVVHVDLG
jgi:Protein phosphatase 2C